VGGVQWLYIERMRRTDIPRLYKRWDQYNTICVKRTRNSDVELLAHWTKLDKSFCVNLRTLRIFVVFSIYFTTLVILAEFRATSVLAFFQCVKSLWKLSYLYLRSPKSLSFRRPKSVLQEFKNFLVIWILCGWIMLVS
jgi:hypothetical protein